MQQALVNQLVSLNEELEMAIEWAALRPFAAAGNRWARIEAICLSIMRDESQSCLNAAAESPVSALVWDIRHRSGRLKLLIDSAARLAGNCLPGSGTQDLGYGSDGEMRPHSEGY